MKKIFVILAACAMALCASSCFKEASSLELNPTSVTVKVGQKVQMHPVIRGFDINDDDLRVINVRNGVCEMDESYQVEGLRPGKSRVGIGVPIDKDDVNKGMKYEVYSEVTVVE